jgi:hypothetical protein
MLRSVAHAQTRSKALGFIKYVLAQSRAPLPRGRGSLTRADLQYPLDFRFLESQNDLGALYQDGPFDEIRVRRHQIQRFGSRRRIVLHLALAIKLVARVQERAVVALADEAVQLLDG